MVIHRTRIHLTCISHLNLVDWNTKTSVVHWSFFIISFQSNERVSNTKTQLWGLRWSQLKIVYSEFWGWATWHKLELHVCEYAFVLFKQVQYISRHNIDPCRRTTKKRSHSSVHVRQCMFMIYGTSGTRDLVVYTCVCPWSDIACIARERGWMCAYLRAAIGPYFIGLWKPINLSHS